MKWIIYILMAVLTVSVASGFHVDVDCNGPEWWNTRMCQDQELQDEFDQVSDEINSMQAWMENNALWDSKQNVWIFKNKRNIKRLQNYIKDNEGAWLKDETGGGGIGRDTLGRLLINDTKWFYHNDMTFYEFLSDQFVTKTFVEDIMFRLDKLEALVKGNNETESLQYALMKQSERLQQTVHYAGYTCDMYNCVMLN